MLELPEILTLTSQLKAAAAGKTVRRVLPPTKVHKFCWFSGDPASYDAALRGRVLRGAEGFGIYAELDFGEGCRLCVCDGMNVRLVSGEKAPKNYQLLIELEDDSALVFTVAMYGGIYLHEGALEGPYYAKSRAAVSPLSADFAPHFRKVLVESPDTLSAKAFLATEQRFPGLGNGVLQDILFAARIHPKRKLRDLTEAERERLLSAVVSVLGEMTAQGGRDTEKDLFGRAGGYATKMSKNTLAHGCPVCGGAITKEAYLGGSVYYCPACQKL